MLWLKDHELIWTLGCTGWIKSKFHEDSNESRTSLLQQTFYTGTVMDGYFQYQVARSCSSESGQIIIIHQPKFPWNKGISLTKPLFGVRSCEVAIIWPAECKSIACDVSSVSRKTGECILVVDPSPTSIILQKPASAITIQALLITGFYISSRSYIRLSKGQRPLTACTFPCAS